MESSAKYVVQQGKQNTGHAMNNVGEKRHLHKCVYMCACIHNVYN